MKRPPHNTPPPLPRNVYIGGLLDISTQFVSTVRYVYKFQNYFPPNRAVFSPKNVILILIYVVSKFMEKNSRFHGKIARYDVLKIKFVDISHRRFKLRRDIEQQPSTSFSCFCACLLHHTPFFCSCAVSPSHVKLFLCLLFHIQRVLSYPLHYTLPLGVFF